MNAEEVQRILAKIEYRAWEFVFDAALFALKVKFVGLDPMNPESCPPVEHSGRWWRISKHMTKSEVVQTAFKAVLTAEEHEIREQFLFRGQPVYSPHYDVDVLVMIHEHQKGLDVREDDRNRGWEADNALIATPTVLSETLPLYPADGLKWLR